MDKDQTWVEKLPHVALNAVDVLHLLSHGDKEPMEMDSKQPMGTD